MIAQDGGLWWVKAREECMTSKISEIVSCIATEATYIER